VSAGAPPLRAGCVALVGWTNVGKSTLLNRLVGDKLAAVAGASQTTRARIRGVLHAPERGQVVFIDTPGLHAPRSLLNRAMIGQLRAGLAEADVIALVVDAAAGIGPGDRRAGALAARYDAPRVAVLNKIDALRSRARLLPLMRVVVEEWGCAAALPVSAATGEGCAALVEDLFARLPEAGPALPDDYLTDQPLRRLAAEWIREKLLALTRAELPHAIAVLIERWNDTGEGAIEIHAAILVDRASQKRIVIGREARMLAEAGAAARLELERLLDRPVVIELWVKVRGDWRNDERILRELGL
jgi:GTP-binding protein Era